MIKDEFKQNARFYNKSFSFEKYMPMVYKFMFEDMHKEAKQRIDTLNLAFGFFIQICTKMKNEESDFVNMMIACILLASKLDEIDDNLLTSEFILNKFLNSKYTIGN